jgi:hypothetical protein
MVDKAPSSSVARVMNGWLASALAVATGVLLVPVALISLFALAMRCAPDGWEVVPGTALARLCSGSVTEALTSVVVLGPAVALITGAVLSGRRRRWPPILIAIPLAAACAAAPLGLLLAIPESYV